MLESYLIGTKCHRTDAEIERDEANARKAAHLALRLARVVAPARSNPRASNSPSPREGAGGGAIVEARRPDQAGPPPVVSVMSDVVKPESVVPAVSPPAASTTHAPKPDASMPSRSSTPATTRPPTSPERRSAPPPGSQSPEPPDQQHAPQFPRSSLVGAMRSTQGATEWTPGTPRPKDARSPSSLSSAASPSPPDSRTPIPPSAPSIRETPSHPPSRPSTITSPPSTPPPPIADSS
jgi:hypothetical protein